jgi:hypothetical protein
MKISLVVAFSALLVSPSLAIEELPNPKLTPGAVRTVEHDKICITGTKYLRVNTAKLTRQVLALYGRKRHKGFEIDHLIPLGIGGANVVENLWPQSWPQARKKDRLEWHLRDLICKEGVDPVPLQNAIAADWRRAYEEYMQ